MNICDWYPVFLREMILFRRRLFKLGYLLSAMSSITNSYNWIANSVNLGRLYFKTFQALVQAPISFFHIVLGEVLSGVVKGLFAVPLMVVVGILTDSKDFITLPFLVALFLNCFLFASLGFVVGLISKGHEETATIRKHFLDLKALISLLVLIVYSIFCFSWGIKLMKNYTE